MASQVKPVLKARDAQRARTRAALFAAAAEVFAKKPYNAATIDDIIRAAGVSRVTFYLHFDSKRALAQALWDEIEADWMILFDELADDFARQGEGSLPWLQDWIVRLIDVYVRHGFLSVLFAQLDAFDDEFHRRVRIERNKLIDRLDKLEAFHAAQGSSEEAQRQRVRLHLMLKQLDAHCSEIALRGEFPDSALATEILAQQWDSALRRV